MACLRTVELYITIAQQVASGTKPWPTLTFKDEGLCFDCLGSDDGQHLLSNHAQHLQLNAVELIKAGPGTRAGKTFEELGLQCSKTERSAQEAGC